MPQLAALTINDGAITPVAHTFSPVTTDGFSASLQERVGIPMGQAKLVVSVRPPVKGGEVYKLRIGFTVPTVVVVDGKSVIDYTHTASLELLCPDRGALQNRKDLLAFVKNSLSNATLVTLVENLEPLY